MLTQEHLVVPSSGEVPSDAAQRPAAVPRQGLFSSRRPGGQCEFRHDG